MERIEEIRETLEFLVAAYGTDAEESALKFLLAEVDRQAAQLSRIKAALLLAGCSDFSEDVAEMVEEFLAQGEEG